MNKSELLAAIAEKTNQSKAATGEFLDATIAVIEAAVFFRRPGCSGWFRHLQGRSARRS